MGEDSSASPEVGRAARSDEIRADLDLVRLLQTIAVAANEARTVDGALQTCVDQVCDHIDWPVGHAYVRDDQTGAFLPSGVWHLREPERFARFREITGSRKVMPGEGLLGQVAVSGRPLWVGDVTRDPTYVRGAAGNLGVAAGLMVPILVGQEVVGVLEFYSGETLEPDESLLPVLAQIGSEAKFAGIISISSDAIVSVDEEQRISFFNQGAEQIFGYEADEVLGQPLDLLIPQPLRPGHRAHVEEFAAGPVAARRMGERGQISGLRKNGEVFPADASISKLQVGGKRIYTAVLRDVTDRVRAEQELARSNAELEQFAYVASHDLQEPLRMVASYTQLLARRYGEQLDDDAREFIGFAVDGVTRMQALINDLLAFSRVGTRGARPEPTQADTVLDRVLANLSHAVEESQALVTREPLPTVTVDATQLGQVFQNLIGNALKFRNPGEPPRVHVSARRGMHEWVFSVADNGIGIAPEFAERIFVLFQRLHSRAEYPGTGIGLAICKKIVERHGGRIWPDSAPGQGTTFHFSIPDHPRSGI
jgi:PAS domain S-box-containing protein